MEILKIEEPHIILLAFIAVILAAGVYFTYRHIRSLTQKVDKIKLKLDSTPDYYDFLTYSEKVDEVDKRFFVPFRAIESLTQKVDRMEENLKWTDHSIESLRGKTDKIEQDFEELIEKIKNEMKDYKENIGIYSKSD